MSENTASKSADLDAQLWSIMTKLYGIGELIKFNNGEDAKNQDEVNHGIGLILTDLADELREVREELESRGPDWRGRDGNDGSVAETEEDG